MGLTSIDAFALAQMARKRDQEQGNGMTFPASGPPSMLADPDLLAAAVAARRAPMPARSDLLGKGGGIDDAVLLSLLDQQRRCSQLPAPSHPGVPELLRSAASDVGAAAPPTPPAPSARSVPPSRRRKPNFAEKLHAMLSDKDCRGVVTWLPSGRAFCITDQKAFVKTVMPKHFREAKFESFNRRLKRWGFRKDYSMGLNQTVFAHDLFHRDRGDLCQYMNSWDRAAPGRAAPGPAANPGVTVQDQIWDGAMLRLAQQQMASQKLSSILALAQPQGPSPPGAGGALVEAILNKAGAQTSDSQSRVNSGSAMLAAAQPLGPSPPGAGGSLAQAILNKPGSAVLAAAQPRSYSFPSAGGSPNKAMAGADDPTVKVKLEGTNGIHQARFELNRISDDIANYNEQLVILQRLRELKKAHSLLGGASNGPQ